MLLVLLARYTVTTLRDAWLQGTMFCMKDITFTVTPCDETGGFVARWDDTPGRGGITTQGDSLAELHEMIADAVQGYFEPENRPKKVRLHFEEDLIFSLT